MHKSKEHGEKEVELRFFLTPLHYGDYLQALRFGRFALWETWTYVGLRDDLEDLDTKTIWYPTSYCRLLLL